MSVQDEITRLENAKTALKTSIESKGVSVPSDATLSEYASLVDDITMVTVDETLTVSGAAADAKATGDKLATKIDKVDGFSITKSGTSPNDTTIARVQDSNGAIAQLNTGLNNPNLLVAKDNAMKMTSYQYDKINTTNYDSNWNATSYERLLPNKSGTFAMLDDIPESSGGNYYEKQSKITIEDYFENATTRIRNGDILLAMNSDGPWAGLKSGSTYEYSLFFRNGEKRYYIHPSLTSTASNGNYHLIFPDKNGTLATLDDIPTSGGGGVGTHCYTFWIDEVNSYSVSDTETYAISDVQFDIYSERDDLTLSEMISEQFFENYPDYNVGICQALRLEDYSTKILPVAIEIVALGEYNGVCGFTFKLWINDEEYECEGNTEIDSEYGEYMGLIKRW